MELIVAALADQHRELSGLLSGLTEEKWSLPTRCPGWSVADVVLHLAQTDTVAVASLTGDFEQAAFDYVRGLDATGDVGADIDDVAGRAVDRDRGLPAAEIHETWRSEAERLREAAIEADPRARVLWVSGDMAARTLATTRLAETWIHSEDVAGALAIDLVPTDRLRHIARLAWRTVPYAFARADRRLSGPVAFELGGPSGDVWSFSPDERPATVVSGPAVDLCRVAGQRLSPSDSALTAEGPDAGAVLELVRTFA